MSLSAAKMLLQRTYFEVKPQARDVRVTVSQSSPVGKVLQPADVSLVRAKNDVQMLCSAAGCQG